MTGELLAIGVDPGPMPGIVALRWSGVLLERVEVVQCTPGMAGGVVRDLLLLDHHPDLRAVVQTERFVVGRGSGKSGRAGAITRDLVGELRAVVSGFQATDRAAFTQQSAGRVKPWATDARLHAVTFPKYLRLTRPDLYRLTAGVQHARDAARHALFAACHDGGIPDPLSKTTHTEGDEA